MRKDHAAAVVGLGLVAVLLWRRRSPVPHVETSEGFDLSPFGGPTTYPQGINDMADAIARAEGFYVAGSIPARAHNPGDLKVPGWTGATLGAGISVFQNDAAGFAALKKQLYLIVTGQSGVYTLDMTIRQMADSWTGGDNADSWARNVAGFLGADASAPLWSVIA